ncbi:MAG: cytochrome ubiquinol oxidase subunit [Actinomycetia bacterium]|nr:cytochrome ubiquinol oxidase subunit [Actinomycetes bacterium]MDQ1459429.1 cytochrome bd ubiquinol oxidase subunit [Actinomycetota bacterium]
MLGVLAVDQPDLFYARQQMAFSLGFHIVLACIGMSVPFLVVLAEWKGQRTGDPVYTTLARRWAKVMGVLFAVGAVSGTILSFEFGILWPRWMGRFGDVMGLPFAMEGFAFFLEAIFIGIYLYGWDRLPPRVHLWSGVPIGVAGVASAFFVVAANGWMNDPTGFTVDAAGNVTHVDPWAALFNSALWPEAIHMILAAFIVGGCLVAMPYGWAMLRGRRARYERVGLLLPLTVAMLAAPLQIVVGDWAARHVAEHQPAKLAAIEGLYATTKDAPLHIGGIYIDNEVKGGIRIPDGLSILAFHNPNAVVKGLAEVPPADRPPVNVVRIAFQLMVAIGTAFVGLGLWMFLAWRRRQSVPRSRWFLRGVVFAGPASVVALECGWITTEVGRQPWIVWNVMRVRDAVTDAPNIRYGYYLLLVVYAFMALFSVIVIRRLVASPLPAELTTVDDTGAEP